MGKKVFDQNRKASFKKSLTVAFKENAAKESLPPQERSQSPRDRYDPSKYGVASCGHAHCDSCEDGQAGKPIVAESGRENDIFLHNDEGKKNYKNLQRRVEEATEHGSALHLLKVHEWERLIWEKLQPHFKSGAIGIRKAFSHFSQSSDSWEVGPTEFWKMLAGFGIQIPEDAALAVFSKYDIDGNGSISFDEFLENLRPGEYEVPLPEQTPQLSTPFATKKNSFIPKQPVRRLRSEHMVPPKDAGELEILLQEKLRTKLTGGELEIRQAFKSFDVDGSGEVDFDEFQMALRHLGLDLPDDHMHCLFERYDTNGTGGIPYGVFVSHLLPQENHQLGDSDLPTQPWATPKTAAAASRTLFGRRMSRPIETINQMRDQEGDVSRKLKTEEIERMVRDKVQSKVSGGRLALSRAFKGFDTDESGEIDIDEFRGILSSFGIQISEEQLTHLFAKHDTEGDGLLRFPQFLAMIFPPDVEVPLQETESSLVPPYATKKNNFIPKQKVRRLRPHEVEHNLSPQEVQDLVREKLRAKCKSGPAEMRKAFKLFDKDDSGDVDRDEFRDVLCSFGVILSDQSFDQFYAKFDEDGSGEIDFNEFIENIFPAEEPNELGQTFLQKRPPFAASHPTDSLHERDERDEARPKRRSKKMIEKTKDHDVNPALFGRQKPEDIEKHVRQKLSARNRSGLYELRKAFTYFDWDHSGEIDYDEFRGLLRGFGIILPENQLQELFAKYDTSGDGDISFKEFVEGFLGEDYEVALPETNAHVIPPYATKVNSCPPPKVKPRLTTPKDQFTKNPEELEKILQERLRGKLKSGAYAIRRAFKYYDRNNCGKVNLEAFSHALRDLGLTFPPRTARILFDYYDVDSAELVSYNDVVDCLIPDDVGQLGRPLWSRDQPHVSSGTFQTDRGSDLFQYREDHRAKRSIETIKLLEEEDSRRALKRTTAEIEKDIVNRIRQRVTKLPALKRDLRYLGWDGRDINEQLFRRILMYYSIEVDYREVQRVFRQYSKKTFVKKGVQIDILKFDKLVELFLGTLDEPAFADVVKDSRGLRDRILAWNDEEEPSSPIPGLEHLYNNKDEDEESYLPLKSPQSLSTPNRRSKKNVPKSGIAGPIRQRPQVPTLDPTIPYEDDPKLLRRDSFTESMYEEPQQIDDMVPLLDIDYLPEPKGTIEDQVIEEHNFLRSHPREYASLVNNYKHNYQGLLVKQGSVVYFSHEGVPAVEECVRELTREDSIAPLQYNDDLASAARDRYNDLYKKKIRKRVSDSDKALKSVRQYTELDETGIVVEAIACWESSARNIVIQTLVNDGNKHRPHRRCILGSSGQKYTHIGVAFGPHKDCGFICVILYARGLVQKRYDLKPSQLQPPYPLNAHTLAVKLYNKTTCATARTGGGYQHVHGKAVEEPADTFLCADTSNALVRAMYREGGQPLDLLLAQRDLTDFVRIARAQNVIADRIPSSSARVHKHDGKVCHQVHDHSTFIKGCQRVKDDPEDGPLLFFLNAVAEKASAEQESEECCCHGNPSPERPKKRATEKSIAQYTFVPLPARGQPSSIVNAMAVRRIPRKNDCIATIHADNSFSVGHVHHVSKPKGAKLAVRWIHRKEVPTGKGFMTKFVEVAVNDILRITNIPGSSVEDEDEQF